ncbi:MAG TPA: PKD domain-containing protein [Chitinophagaceae bacterium]|nr:PKD domain-containing protein [Chitinophagaceae bacterium]
MRKVRYYTLSKLAALFVTLFLGSAVFSQTPVANFSGSPLAGCTPLIVNFTNLSTGNPTIYSWDFGNGNTSSITNPSASYFTPGTYTVKLTATNANGSNTMTKTQYITVYETPTVNFTANITAGCFPLVVQFTDMSTAGAGNTNTSWQWDFGNGLTSTQQNPTVTYTAAGSFSVTLKVTNDKGCIKTLNKPNFINPTQGVVAGFTNTQPVVCSPPSSITFTNNSTGPGILTYDWNFGDGNTSTAQNPVHAYNSSGSYNVTLIVSSSSGCVDTAKTTTPIIIGGITTSFSSLDSVCVNSSISFTNTSNPTPSSSSWNFGDGWTDPNPSTSHVYTTPGTYTVHLYNVYASCNDSASKVIRVNGLPTPDFTSADTTKCQPSLTSHFTDLSTGAVGWQWDFGDGGTSTAQNPTHTYSTYGYFTVKLIVTNSSGCKDSISKIDFVRIRRAIISIPALPDNGCIPFTTNPVPVVNSLDNVLTWAWTFGDGATSTSQNPSHTYIAQGNYNIKLTITTSSGCTDSLIIAPAIRVGSHPSVNFSAVPTTQCSYQTVQFTDLSVPSDQWIWNFGDGAGSTTQNPTHIYTQPGTYDVTLIAYNNGCPDSIRKTNYVSILPPVSLFSFTGNCTIRNQFQFNDQSVGALSWAWDFGDGTTSTATNPLHNFPALGTYTVSLTVTNGACSHTTSQTVHAIDPTPDFTASPLTACKNSTIDFTATNGNISDIYSFTWSFGDGNQQSATIPTISNVYVNSGTYTVRLITTDLNNCMDTTIKTNYIRINGPLAGFTASNTSGCKGMTTVFQDLSVPDGVNAITNWQWDFGDGTIQNLSGPPFQHTYNSLGTFTVKLKVTDAAGCTDSTISVNLVYTETITASFTSPDTLSCPGANVSFTNTLADIYHTSFWDFGDGNTSTNPLPVHQYAVTGNYTVKLRVTHTNGCADSLTRNLYIQVNNPHADFTMSDSVSSCIPLEVLFTNNSTYYTSSLWDFGPGGSSTVNNPTHYFTTPGTQNIKLIVTSPGGCLDSLVKTVTLYDTAGSTITYSPLGGCKPLSASFNAFSAGPMSNYIWDFGDGSSQTTAVPSANHIYQTLGDFVPTVVLEDPGGCFIPVTGIDTVHVIGVTAKFGFDRSVLCDNGPVNFIDSTLLNDPITNYSWAFGDGGTSGQQNPLHQYLSPGFYNVQLAVLSQNGCTDTLIKPNAIKVVQRPLIDIGGDTVACVNSSMIHTGLFIQPDTSIVSWSWTFPNGTTTNQQNPSPQTYRTVGTFTVRAIATNSTGCKDTSTQNIRLNPLPSAVLPVQMTIQTGFPVTIPATYSPGVVSWEWSPATGLSCTDCPTPIADTKFKTLYTVAYTDTNGCQNLSYVEVIVICKNVNLFIPNTFSPNGNGSNDVFYPRGVGLDRVKLLRIFNRWGEVVFEKKDFPINDPSVGWDGTYKGRKPIADVYVYQAEVFCENGEIIVLNGNIALIL